MRKHRFVALADLLPPRERASLWLALRQYGDGDTEAAISTLKAGNLPTDLGLHAYQVVKDTSQEIAAGALHPRKQELLRRIVLATICAWLVFWLYQVVVGYLYGFDAFLAYPLPRRFHNNDTEALIRVGIAVAGLPIFSLLGRAVSWIMAAAGRQ